MKTVGMVVVVVLMLVVVAWGQQDPMDAGIADTLRFAGGPLVLGESRPIDVIVYNDEVVVSMTFSMKWQPVDSGFARVDSVVYVDRTADPSILDLRFAATMFADGVSPDSIWFGLLRNFENPLPPGHGTIVRVYLTGLHVGKMSIDTCHGSYGAALWFIPRQSDQSKYRPRTAALEVDVMSPSVGPEILFSEVSGLVQVANGVNVEASLTSPAGFEPLLTDCRVTNLDDESRLPIGALSTTGTNPLLISWATTPGDVGIWKLVLTVCGDSANCTADSVELQVVDGEAFAGDFDVAMTTRPAANVSIQRIDFDSDGYDEFVITGGLGGDKTDAIAFFRVVGDSFAKVASYPSPDFQKGLQVGYINGDTHFDVAFLTPISRELTALLGNGDMTYVVNPGDLLFESERPITGTLDEFTGDGNLDYLSIGPLSYRLYIGSGEGNFSTGSGGSFPDSAKTISSADVNRDGATDLLIGTISGIDMLLNDGAGSFTRANHYVQDFRALDLDVTSQGSDFNDDNIFDLSVATPSVGGEFSEVLVYLSDGSGGLTAHVIRRVRGQCFATVIGDFNNDLHLDIAYTNSTKKYIGILYGEGGETFVNERRFPIVGATPRALDASDVDRDGDLDLIAGSYFKLNDCNLILLRNRLDPPGFIPSRLSVSAQNNIDAELVSPSGQTLNSVKRTIASGSALVRNADGNNVIDEALSATAIESGPYQVLARPKVGQATDAAFSIDFMVDAKKYRLTENQPNRTDGYRFTIYPDGSCPVSPEVGAIVTSPNPQLTWPSSGEIIIEIARDLSFSETLESATTGIGNYTPVEALGAGSDTVTYYWRTTNSQSQEVSDIYVFSVAPTPTGVDPNTDDGLPRDFSLAQNYPNPFNPSTTIAFALPTAQHVTVSIYDVTGRLVRRLLDTDLPAGDHSVVWSGNDNKNRDVSSGIYLYRLQAGSFHAEKKMTLVR